MEDELLEMGEEPPLMKPGRKHDLIAWLLGKLHVARFKQGPMRGRPQLVLEYQLDEDTQVSGVRGVPCSGRCGRVGSGGVEYR